MQIHTYTQNSAPSIAHDAAGNTTSRANFKRVLRRFAPTSLVQMHNVSLLRRIDTKYVMSEAQLYQALSRITADYDVLEIAGRRLHRYQTLYFDTPDFALYRQHHDGWRDRYKVRSRIYADSSLSFLEVKRKTNKNVTVKSRLRTPEVVTQVSSPHNTGIDSFLHANYPQTTETLAPRLWNDFHRITLVSKHSVERLTLDIGLQFQAGGVQFALPHIAVAEVKQEAFSLRSEFVGQMRALGVRPTGFSKYCVGISRFYDQVKSNNFKPLWRHIDKLTEERR